MCLALNTVYLYRLEGWHIVTLPRQWNQGCREEIYNRGGARSGVGDGSLGGGGGGGGHDGFDAVRKRGRGSIGLV